MAGDEGRSITDMTYPTVEQVSTAGVEAVLRWNRFLPSPRTLEQVKVVDAVVARLKVLREAKPQAYVAASKSIGW
jgi:pyruvate-formate lyase-activating enzyme